MVPSPAKRAKVAHGSLQHTQPKLRDLFTKSAHLQQQQSERRPLSDKNREDAELEWAIQESLKEADALETRDIPQPFPAPETALESSYTADARNDSTESIQPLQAFVPSLDSVRPAAHPLQSKGASSNSSSTSAASTSSTKLSSNTSTKQLSESPAIPAPVKTSGRASNAFDKLMSSHSEAKEWATADVVESRNYSGAARSRPQRRTAPFYKVLTGMPISVDAFRFSEIEGCEAYFLSHFHADHYGGLTSTWSHGPIYCSVTTANLVRSSLRVQDMHVCPLPMNETVVIPRTGGVKVTLLDANHCPGSCVFLFEGPQTCHILPTQPGYTHPPLPPPTKNFRYLHCGDFRASPRHAFHPLIKGKRLDIIYLDTTYCNPRYCFPAQEMVVEACAKQLQLVAPEQCRIGQLAKKQWKDEEQEDWRTSPLKGKRLEAAVKAEEDRKASVALKGWLDSKVDDSEAKGGNRAAASNLLPAFQDDEDLGDMDFRDEEAAFLNDTASTNSNDDYQEDAMVLDAEEGGEEAGSREPSDQGECAPTTRDDCFSAGARVKTEQIEDCEEFNQTDALEIDEKSGLGAATIKTEDPKHGPKGEVKEEPFEGQGDIKPDYRRVLVVVGTYTIGKEKIVLACARALGTKVFCADPRKYKVYAQLEDAELHSLLTRDPHKAYVHVTSLMTIGGDALQEHTSRMRSQGMRIDRAIAFRPTGWTYRPPAGMDVVSPSLDRLIQWNQRRTFGPSHFFTTRDSTQQYTIFGVPYSEHSSFFELTAFCLSVDYGRIIATVNVGNANSRAKMARWFEKWKAEKKRRNFLPLDARSLEYF